jgi:hypothetical protein
MLRRGTLMPFWDRLFRKKKDTLSHIQADLAEIQRLEALSKRDPYTIRPLIQLHKQVLGYLSSGEYAALRATLQHNLGNAYRDLSTGNHGANLKRAIACYQEALRIFTPETAPRNYSLTQTARFLEWQRAQPPAW